MGVELLLDLTLQSFFALVVMQLPDNIGDALQNLVQGGFLVSGVLQLRHCLRARRDHLIVFVLQPLCKERVAQNLPSLRRWTEKVIHHGTRLEQIGGRLVRPYSAVDAGCLRLLQQGFRVLED